MYRPFLLSARSRKLLAAAALFATALVVSAALAPSPSAAQTRCGTEIWYWSDETYSELVGMRGWLPDYCGCQYYYWGDITAYRTYEDSYC